MISEVDKQFQEVLIRVVVVSTTLRKIRSSSLIRFWELNRFVETIEPDLQKRSSRKTDAKNSREFKV